jgi:hypothetical protein
MNFPSFYDSFLCFSNEWRCSLRKNFKFGNSWKVAPLFKGELQCNLFTLILSLNLIIVILWFIIFSEHKFQDIYFLDFTLFFISFSVHHLFLKKQEFIILFWFSILKLVIQTFCFSPLIKLTLLFSHFSRWNAMLQSLI